MNDNINSKIENDFRELSDRLFKLLDLSIEVRKQYQTEEEKEADKPFIKTMKESILSIKRFHVNKNYNNPYLRIKEFFTINN